MLNIVMFGAPGSGKGTHSDRLVEKFNLMHISSGELLREEIKNETAIGLEVKDIISKGHLASDEIIISLLRRAITATSRNYRGYIFDGFPRTVHQAEKLDNMLGEINQKLDVILNLEVEEQTLIDRLLSRGKTSGRSDDNLETITNRLEIYKTQTLPILEYYRERDCYTPINNNVTIEESFTQIYAAVNSAVNLNNATNID